jgi:xanthine dehydrogenase molybdopterin-binding subunit B
MTSFLRSRTKTASQGIGKPIPRKEDERLLRGQGCYTDDLNLPRQAYAGVVRSPHAHARIRSIDTSTALAMPGVLAVLTGNDAEQDGLKPVPFRPVSPNPHEVQLKASFLAPYPLLPQDRARFVGQAVKINVNLPLDGRRRFHGTIREIDGDRITIEQDGEPITLVHANIAKARLAPDYAALGLAAARREYEEGAPKKRSKGSRK